MPFFFFLDTFFYLRSLQSENELDDDDSMELETLKLFNVYCNFASFKRIIDISNKNTWLWESADEVFRPKSMSTSCRARLTPPSTLYSEIDL